VLSIGKCYLHCTYMYPFSPPAHAHARTLTAFPIKAPASDQRSTIDDTAAADIRRGSLWGLDALGTIGPEKSILTQAPSTSFLLLHQIHLHLSSPQASRNRVAPLSFVFPLSLGSVFIAGLPSLRSLVLGTCSALLQVLLLSRQLFSSQRGPPRSPLRQSCSALPSSSDLI